MPGFYQPVQAFLKRFGLENEGEEILTSHKHLFSFVQDGDPTCPVHGLALGQAEQIWSAAAHRDLSQRRCIMSCGTVTLRRCSGGWPNHCCGASCPEAPWTGRWFCLEGAGAPRAALNGGPHGSL